MCSQLRVDPSLAKPSLSFCLIVMILSAIPLTSCNLKHVLFSIHILYNVVDILANLRSIHMLYLKYLLTIQLLMRDRTIQLLPI